MFRISGGIFIFVLSFHLSLMDSGVKTINEWSEAEAILKKRSGPKDVVVLLLGWTQCSYSQATDPNYYTDCTTLYTETTLCLRSFKDSFPANDSFKMHFPYPDFNVFPFIVFYKAGIRINNVTTSDPDILKSAFDSANKN
ncbi:uncharacterized protein LOC111046508 [Nilaparvata lugens]|uniref:uncharacterized protein LOC111046508 n=1 Tax=Nilaparvata lugens TaxID=108931 RepID=UPI00193D4CEA|nr:uncharacterized protein LOC111046508 [Nilaparvata lugens]